MAITRSLINEARKIMEAKGIEYAISMKDASFFKGNDLMKAIKKGDIDDLDMHEGGGTDLVFTANSPSEVQRNAEKAILAYRNKDVKNDRNAVYVFTGLELILVGDELPTSSQKNMLKKVFNKFDSKPMFNTPNGRGPSNLEKFVKDESLDDMLIQGVM